MSETVKVGRNRPPQNGWASKEEVAELRAEVAELRETNQAMLEEIKGLRAELGGAKRRHFLGAVATSAAAFFGKFFHRGEDLGDFHEEKSSKGANRGAHAKGKEKEKEKEKEKGGAPIVPARRDEKSKISREQEDKRNKDKRPMWQKAAAVVATVAVAAGVWAFANSPHKNAQDLPKDPSITETNANLHMPETEQALAEQAVEAAEAAHQQQLAETMGMSVEEMHAVADRHGVNHNDIGTAKAHDQMRDNMESSYNLSEKIDLENMSEAERSERSKQEILFANMNNKYVTAQISSARLGAHDASDSELTQRLFKQYEENDATWQEHAKENAEFLKASTYSTRLARTSKTYTYGTEGQWDGPIEKQYVTENSGGETVYIAEVTNGDIKMQFKDGCVQAVWVEEAAQPRQQAKERTVVRQEVVQQEERHQEKRQSQQYSWNRRNDQEEHRQNDSKDPKANDTQQNNAENFEDDSKANDDAPTYGGQKNPDASAKSGNTDNNPDNGSEVVPDDKNGSIGGKQDAKPGQQDWGGGGAADNGQDKTTAKSGDQGGSGKDTTGGNRTDSGSGGEETDHRSSSQHRNIHSEEGGSVTTDENGNTTGKSYSSTSDTGWVNDDDTGGGNVELQNTVVPGV